MSNLKPIFCAQEQAVTDHELRANPANLNEIEAVCVDCGRVLKFDARQTPEDFEAQIVAHEDANKGQVPIAPVVVPEPAPVEVVPEVEQPVADTNVPWSDNLIPEPQVEAVQPPAPSI